MSQTRNVPHFGWFPIVLCFGVGALSGLAWLSLTGGMAATFFSVLLCVLADEIIRAKEAK